LSDAVQVETLAAGAVRAFGRLDYAVNNADIYGAGAPVVDADPAEFDQVFGTDVRGVWLLMQQEARIMVGQGGSAIVNTSSIAATGGTKGLSIYAASKGALDSMIRPLALALGSSGIRINNVGPGMTRTPVTAGIPEEWMTAIGGHAALGRVAEAEDVARAAVWLCSPGAGFVTGRSLLVDGGFNIPGQR
jgi:NAD(P)-dependent dehydrogenase (short-subunit alcohol dehydrogenase family)